MDPLMLPTLNNPRITLVKTLNSQASLLSRTLVFAQQCWILSVDPKAVMGIMKAFHHKVLRPFHHKELIAHTEGPLIPFTFG